MDKLTSMKVFAYVVEHGSFRRAADHFALSATMISKHIHSLETGLNTQLLHRTTRKQSLTDSGQLYYRECKRILEDISNAENLIQTLENKPQGTVKINSPITYGNKVLAPIIAKFLSQHPSINVELMLNNDLVDPYSSDIDLIVRIGDLTDSSLVARHLGDYEMIYCVSPCYLKHHPTIESLDDLANHPSLGFSYSSRGDSQTKQTATQSGTSEHIRLTSNNGDVLRYAALQGVGVLLQPRILVEEELEKGVLQEILVGQTPKPKPIHLLYKTKQLSLKNRTFVDFVLNELALTK
ncbi:LysR family transcriptional regulator [Vibrio sp. D404a]|uniref:LysR substrate-binding domain-containing protein n=1 Tax=unclassified Vibrio TaxID=2614977 RepID=UPI002556AED5|nr:MULTISPECIES: LysR substrate-binding domain-containing protein [unclassified Vibrio]MDK9736781.1 LysR family transcriptional regulator [Vibrio sp. D404a]MDK9795801.1 LysR family transcriptional regulator [Vibrio sp. D449a]